MTTAQEHAARQSAMYAQIWSADSTYGTAMLDVKDTVRHRIVPHMHRVFGGNNFTIIDFGAGDGRFLGELAGMIGPWTIMAGVDLYKPEHLPRGICWFQQPMWEPLHVAYDYAISTDALEHLPPDMVRQTLENIARSTPHGFLRISLIEDRYGTARGMHLHESVFPAEVWLSLLATAGIKVTSYRVYLDDNGERALEVWF